MRVVRMDDKVREASCSMDVKKVVCGLNEIAVGVHGNVHSSGESFGEGLKIYKRRKHDNSSKSKTELLHKGKNSADSSAKYQDKVYTGKCLVEKSSAACQVLYEEPTDVYRSFDCHLCGEVTEGKNCLVCDSCEEMHHISCIMPTIKDIDAQISWYCAKCTAIQSAHNNCVVCYDYEPNSSSASDNMKFEEETSDDDPYNCLICGGNGKNEEDFKVCGHMYCPHKYYHVRCLTDKQMNTYSSECWYCPSCICLTCLANKDDDKIVLCDACDHTCHIYCMQPPLETVTIEKWLCKVCKVGIQRIQRVRRKYEIVKKQSETGDIRKKRNCCNKRR
ncbi:PHD finger protein EHD3-like [Impatiens glandulifera]|uniref:PHD finger protein EHD3-like n=1 Tax=Impatiens glandulifera TaxID=253017 RepID=UPI001FB1949B|nr:PHD finger protein EHD3-like [Impatiens glandulifera]